LLDDPVFEQPLELAPEVARILRLAAENRMHVRSSGIVNVFGTRLLAMLVASIRSAIRKTAWRMIS
jgi:hypothetical protein